MLPVTPGVSTQWRATGSYTATSIATAGLLAETRLYLDLFATQTGSVSARDEATRQLLVDGALPQRSRESRKTVAKRISERLTRWNPPAWVLDELTLLAQEPSLDTLKAILLVLVCRQDVLLYNVVQQVILPRWHAGERALFAVDVHRFLDAEAPAHPEIDAWAYATRNRLASNTLSTLRDYGLLRGANHKTIVEPAVPPPAASCLARLLAAEGIAPSELAYHPDWQLWLWNPQRVAQFVIG